jgi:site-specific DNA recombinase
VLWTERSGELDLIRAAIEGERSHDESARKTQSVRAGKRRRAERGEHLGGPLPDGYRVAERWVDERGKLHRRIELDPDRAATVRAILAQALEGTPDAQLARNLNARGVTTRRGRAWTRRTVQSLILNPFYAGKVRYEGTLYDGNHPRLIEPADCERLVAARGERDLGRGRHVKGRPARLHLLQRLAICPGCNRRIVSFTSPYQRKDGTKQRTYRCPSYAESNDSCPVNT